MDTYSIHQQQIMTCKISGAWVVIRTCPYDGTESTLGLFPEGKAALLKLEHFMDDHSEDFYLLMNLFCHGHGDEDQRKFYLDCIASIKDTNHY